MNMEEHNSSLVVETSYPDLVINVGEITLGEGDRNKLQKLQREQEKEKVIQAACALLNSGGGVIRMEMANNHKHLVEMGLDLELSLRTLIQSSDLQAFFETKQKGKCFYIFVKSWNSDPFPEYRSISPRICSVSSSLYRRSETSVLCMDSREAFNFLKTKKRNTKTLEEEPSRKVLKVIPELNLNPVYQIFQKDQLEYGEILPFPESQYVEFKQFSTKHIQEYVKSKIPAYISAFANTGGGYIFIGVDDKSKKVLGCAKGNVDRNSLKMKIEDTIDKLPCVHFCQSQCQITCTPKILDVLANGELYGYACVIRVQPFCCAVFSEAPKSWMVKGKNVCSLTTEEWAGMMMDTDPDLLCLSEDFESQLSLSSSPPLSRPVYSKKGLEHKKDLQKRLFPVSSGLQCTPESLWKELSSEHEGLEELINKQMQPFSQGILILSRSWAVGLNMQEKRGVICDALLVTQNSPPILYTILREQDEEEQFYCTRTALTLKQKLVNMGGYTGKLCVMTKVLHLSPESNAESFEGSGSLIDYPRSYYLADTQQMEGLLQSLVIVLLSFRSFLSDQVGCEILNLLTLQQYEIFSKNLRKNRELFIHGLPGSGKTIMAMKIMEKIKNMFHCEKDEILYVCENQLLRDFIGNKNICCAVTRKTFMSNFNFIKIQHIIIDEAQNFRTEDGYWYDKAKTITQREKDCPGILWIFLDYFQTHHLDDSGLPHFSAQNSREELTRVVRNADPIATYLQNIMQKVRKNPPPNIPPGSLDMLCEAEWAQGIPGNCRIKTYSTLKEIVTYVAEKCQFLLKDGYSPEDIAVLFSKTRDVEKYKDDFLKAVRKRRMSQSNATSTMASNIVLDSVRRFSGLERDIVFGINPRPAEPAIFHNLLLCLASRARKHLYILKLSNDRKTSI